MTNPGRSLFLALVVLFLAAPLVVVAGVSLNAEKQLLFPPHGLSLVWYVELFREPD
jgi:putative spermidine/putrescine transport system permease protein